MPAFPSAPLAPERPTPATLPPRLRRLARLVRLLCLLAAGVLLAAPLLVAGHPAVAALVAQEVVPGGPPGVPAVGVPGGLLLPAATVALASALGLWTLWQLWQLFGEYAAGRVFGAVALGRLQRFARGVAALAVLGAPWRTLLALAFTWHQPPGQRLLVLSVSSNDLWLVLLAAVLLALAEVMAGAVALAEDNAGFV